MQLTVKKVLQENEGVLSIYFDKLKKFSYYPGQYIDLKLPDRDSRSFSLSSSPTERFLMVTVKKGLSDFKKLLEKVRVEDRLTATHPAGTFILDESQPAVFLAGGIGITPFRSMIKYSLDQGLNIPIYLIYSNVDNNFIFKKKLDNWQKKLTNLKIIYINTSTDGRLDQKKLEVIIPKSKFINPKNLLTSSQDLATASSLKSIFYLAGSPSMVEDLKNILLQLQVDETNIRTDEFTGY